jgi:hypothetical protein
MRRPYTPIGLRTSSRPSRPMFESAPYRMHPSRREHIYGRIQSDLQRSVRSERFTRRLVLACVAFPVIWFLAHLMVGGR